MLKTRYLRKDRSPGLVLQLRVQDSRGGMLNGVKQIPTDDAAARHEAVVLVHGYNNDYYEATEAYTRFRDRQYKNTGIAPPGLESLLVDVFWPGDQGNPSFLFYPRDLKAAKRAAWLIATHLRNMPNLLTVHFIGHSMGCRLVLEIIKILKDDDFGPVVGKVCLMAAAVPDFMVAKDGRLADAISQPRNTVVLYSKSDRVLQFGFPSAQTACGAGEGVLPTALGREPPELPLKVYAAKVNQAGHSDYWPGTDTPNERATTYANSLVSTFFNFDRMAPRDIASRSPASSTASFASRQTGANRRSVR